MIRVLNLNKGSHYLTLGTRAAEEESERVDEAITFSLRR